MPIQNVGTLLENMVVTEAAALLLDRVGPGQSLGFASAFAMPALSEWRPHSQAVGVSTEALRLVLESSEKTEFMNVMARCLRYRFDQGPNGVLLVSLLAALRRAGLRVWANDIVDGHYGNAIPSLKAVAGAVGDIAPESRPVMDVSVCDAPYPSSLDDLRRTLDSWKNSVGAVIGFLDPMRYVLDARVGPYTHSVDHRRWLSLLSEWGPSLAVQFTGNSDSRSLRTELEAMRGDLEQSGFPHWIEFRRQHYVVSVGAQEIGVIDALEARTKASWGKWCDCVPEIASRLLDCTRSHNGRETA